MVGCHNLALLISGFSRQFSLIREDIFCIVEMVMPQQWFLFVTILSFFCQCSIITLVCTRNGGKRWKWILVSE